MKYYMDHPLRGLSNDDLLDYAQVCNNCCVITQGKSIA
jgi:hypothetical protein